MTITVRLNPQLQEQLERHCRRRRLTKTQVVTQLLREHLATAAGGRKSPYALAEELGLVGSFAGGKRDVSHTYKRRLRRKLRAKHSR